MNVIYKCDDWNSSVFNKYLPNEDFSEMGWRFLKTDEEVINHRQYEEQQDKRDMLPDPVITAATTIEEALLNVTTFVPPAKVYPNKVANPIRIESFNTVLNSSDLYKIVKSKQASKRILDAKKEGILNRKIKRQQKKDDEIRIQNFLDLSGLVKCNCKNKCTAKCICRVNDQICIHHCLCNCAGKDKSENNQFGVAQRIELSEN